MTREDFLKLLEENNIPVNTVSFEDSISDGYGIRKNYFRWEIFLRERGKEYEVCGYPSESDALITLYEKLLHLYKRNT